MLNSKILKEKRQCHQQINLLMLIYYLHNFFRRTHYNIIESCHFSLPCYNSKDTWELAHTVRSLSALSFKNWPTFSLSLWHYTKLIHMLEWWKGIVEESALELKLWNYFSKQRCVAEMPSPHESFFRPVIKFISTANGELEIKSHTHTPWRVSLLYDARVPVRFKDSPEC